MSLFREMKISTRVTVCVPVWTLCLTQIKKWKPLLVVRRSEKIDGVRLKKDYSTVYWKTKGDKDI